MNLEARKVLGLLHVKFGKSLKDQSHFPGITANDFCNSLKNEFYSKRHSISASRVLRFGFCTKNEEKHIQFCDSVLTKQHKAGVFQNAIKSGYPQKRSFDFNIH